jgi:hypothetical protein
MFRSSWSESVSEASLVVSWSGDLGVSVRGSIADLDGGRDVSGGVVSLRSGFNAAGLQRVRRDGRGFLDDGGGGGHMRRADVRSRGVVSTVMSDDRTVSVGRGGMSVGGGGVRGVGGDRSVSDDRGVDGRRGVDHFGGERGIVTHLRRESVAGDLRGLGEHGGRGLVDGGDRRVVDRDRHGVNGVMHLLHGVQRSVGDRADLGVRHDRHGGVSRGGVLVAPWDGDGTAEQSSEQDLCELSEKGLERARCERAVFRLTMACMVNGFGSVLCE